MPNEMNEIDAKIMETLNSAFYEFHHGNDGSFYVSKGLEFPIWVSASEEKGFIRYFTHINFKDDVELDVEKANELVNRINDKVFPNSVHQDGTSLCAAYHLPMMEEFSGKIFIEMLRRTSGAFIYAIRTFDHDDLIP